jgi:hypothetical protein
MQQEKNHWPFGSGAGLEGGGSGKAQDEQARAAEQAALRQRTRHDRLIAGGRAHTKKRGLN